MLRIVSEAQALDTSSVEEEFRSWLQTSVVFTSGAKEETERITVQPTGPSNVADFI